ncbi:hypothetical protein V6N12_062275 [Hibiscus sabdariffa]|uniref:Reverse transcriptase Ty1/copia-type domain-containing protein n=1 Tax=Hibiscus sabdariffa TaxID=183260 RepID=A0ABR2F8C9_9ROSI
MKVEMEALEKNNTWELVKLPEGKKTVGCKWIFTVKYNSDGSLERYKARLVVKGYSQTYGINYLETFAPVAKMNTVRVLLSLAANRGWKLQQFDVKNAFLHGYLEEEIYMDIPPGFTSSDGQAVCKLKRVLYGLKQLLGAWFGRFTKVMLKQGDDLKGIEDLKKCLVKEFEVKDLGRLKYFLGIEVAYSQQV